MPIGNGQFPISRISKDQNGGLFESNLRILFRNYIPLDGSKKYWQVYTSGYNWPTTYNNLSELYWRNYLNLINDTNSRFLTAKFYLNESDISNLSFKDTIFLNLNGRPMKFLINKISNYNPIMPSLCDVELIKIK